MSHSQFVVDGEKTIMSKMQRLEEIRVPRKTLQEIGRIISRQSQRMKDTRKGDVDENMNMVRDCTTMVENGSWSGSKPSLGTSQEKLRRLADAKNRCQAEREPNFSVEETERESMGWQDQQCKRKKCREEEDMRA